jgi:transposase
MRSTRRRGELRRGRIRPAERESFRHFLRRFEGERIEAALEATTGWRFKVEELRAVGAEVRLAEPAETKMLRGPKRRAKTDRADAKHLRELLQRGRVPESWIPPEQILELLSLVRLRRALVERRTAWQQRIHAQLFHHGHPARRDLLARERRAWLVGLELPHAARTQVGVALRLIDQINVQLEPLDRELRALAARWRAVRQCARRAARGRPASRRSTFRCYFAQKVEHAVRRRRLPRAFDLARTRSCVAGLLRRLAARPGSLAAE